MTKEVIHLGRMEIRFLLDPEDTGGAHSVFQFAVVPGERIPAPHFHKDYDELLYGIDGVLTYTVEGEPHQIGPGDHLFVPRGKVHHFENHGEFTTHTLLIITPGLLGPKYFREMSAIMTVDEPLDPDKVSEIMARHGLFTV